jgi:hypothetical protein
MDGSEGISDIIASALLSREQKKSLPLTRR